MREPFTGWTPEAVSMVERSIAAHGGRQAWQAASRIRLPFQTGSGSLLALKGLERTFPAPRAFQVFPHQRITVFDGYPDAGRRGIFTDGDVRIESADGRNVLEESRDHRRTFHGFAKLRSWSPLDALYFFGYALWHYHVLPFTLGMAQLNRVLSRDGLAHGIEVTFPVAVPTHCRRQQFFFGGDGRIVRHDYVADVIGPMARGAHFWEDYTLSGGLLLARRRRVVVRFGSYATPFTVLRVQLGEPYVQQ